MLTRYVAARVSGTPLLVYGVVTLRKLTCTPENRVRQSRQAFQPCSVGVVVDTAATCYRMLYVLYKTEQAIPPQSSKASRAWLSRPAESRLSTTFLHTDPAIASDYFAYCV